MASNFKETILKLLSATDYPLDSLTEDQISSFENVPHLMPLFEWLSLNITEANCITPEELETFKKLQEDGKVRYGEELEEALRSQSCNVGGSAVPFKESLHDPEQELTLLKEQLHYKQILHQELCSSNAAMDDEIRQLRKKQQKAESEQKEIIKDIYAATNTLKDRVSEVEENINELRDDIAGLAQSPEVSTDEGSHSLTSENTNTSVWSLSTASSWQTIRGKDANIKFLSQMSFDKYKRIHKQFLKRLTKLLEVLSKVGKLESSDLDSMDLHMVKDRLERQMCELIEKEAELEGIRAGRAKVKELHEKLLTVRGLVPTLQLEEKEISNKTEGSLNVSCREELSIACQQWAEYKALQAVEHKMRERIEFSKCVIEKMDELLKPLLLKLNADKILHEILRYEKEKIELSIKLYKTFHTSLQNQFDQMKKRIETMQKNFKDCEEFFALPLEERNDLVEQLASVVLSDNEGVVQTVQHLTESSQREHESIYEDFAQKKIDFILSEEKQKESFNMGVPQCTRDESNSKELFDGIQRSLDQMDSGIEEVNNYIKEVIHTISNGTEECEEEYNYEKS